MQIQKIVLILQLTVNKKPKILGKHALILMKTKYFKKGTAYKHGWEFNLMLGQYQLRIAQYQLALWKNNNAIFNKLS